MFGLGKNLWRHNSSLQTIRILLQLRFQLLPDIVLHFLFYEEMVVIEVFYDERLSFIHSQQNLLDRCITSQKHASDGFHRQSQAAADLIEPASSPLS